jgi:hypothetical protein
MLALAVSSSLTFSPPVSVQQRNRVAPRSAGLPMSVAMEQRALTGSRWLLRVDVGQERGSWMPPAWGRSGDRARLQVVVIFSEGGQLDVLETGPYDSRTCTWDGHGGWEVEGERATFWLPHRGERTPTGLSHHFVELAMAWAGRVLG